MVGREKLVEEQGVPMLGRGVASLLMAQLWDKPSFSV